MTPKKNQKTMQKILIIILIAIAGINTAVGQTITNDDDLIGKTLYLNQSLWNEIEPLAFSRGKLIPVSKIKNDTILQKNYRERNTWFKFLEISEINGKKYYKLETEIRYYYIEKSDKNKYIKYAEFKPNYLKDFNYDDEILTHSVYLSPKLWEIEMPYAIQSGKLKPVSEITNDDILKTDYRNPKTWFRFLEITEIEGAKYYKLETEKRYYYLERKTSQDLYHLYAKEKNTSRKLVGKVFTYQFEIKSSLMATIEISFLSENTVEYNSFTAVSKDPELAYYTSHFTKKVIHKCNTRDDGKIEVFKNDDDTKPIDILEWRGDKLWESKKSIIYTLKE